MNMIVFQISFYYIAADKSIQEITIMIENEFVTHFGDQVSDDINEIVKIKFTTELTL